MPSTGFGTTPYDFVAAILMDRANCSPANLDSPSRASDSPLKNWASISPELPRAPSSAELAIFFEISATELDAYPFKSSSTDFTVKSMLVPVSPSGTGNTFNALMVSLFTSSA